MTSHPAPRGRIFIDVGTSLAWRDRPAVGIVRAEREILARLLDDPNLAVIPVVIHDGTFRAIDPQLARSLAAPIRGAPVEPPAPVVLPPGVIAPEAAKPSLGARLIGPFGRLLRTGARALLRAVPPVAREDVRLALVHLRQAARKILHPPPALLAASAEGGEAAVDFSLRIHPGRDDVLFLCGLTWDVIDWQAVDSLRARSGMRVAAVVYDLIPIKMPEVCHTSTNHMFLNCFLHILDNCNLIMCISQCTRADLLAFAAAEGRPRPHTEVIYLGANVPAAPEPAELIRRGVYQRLVQRRFALAVGTFEVRKNYRVLLDVWDELTADPAFDLDLVIVGWRGWRVNDLIRRIESSRLFGGRIVWLENLSDAALSWLYEACHLFVFPSLYEGWGLPVTEALQHGRPVIASNRGATPEAGFGVATILDPDNLPAWRDAIREAALAPRRSVPVPAMPSWDDTAAAVTRALLGVMSCQQGAA